MLAYIRSVAIATLPLLVAITPAASQELRGRVVTAASGAPIASASIDVLTGTGTASSLAAHANSANDGSFRIQNVRAGRYRVRVRALGYSPHELPSITIGAPPASVDIGTVALSAAALELEAQVVNAQKEEVALAPDRNTYVVRDMPTTRGGSALDVLRNVPSVDVDIDNTVSLRGNPGVVIQINGRKSPLKAAQLGNFLAQLPADIVERVEVIPNPSARDDPEGVAGIINIVLKQESDAGTSGGVSASGGTTGRAEVGGNAGYQRGPLTLYGSYGYWRDNRPRTDAIARTNLYDTPLTYLDESVLRTQVPHVHTVTGSAGYELTKSDELSYDVMYSTRTEQETNTILYRTLDASRNVTGLTDRLSNDINNEMSFESTLGYKHSFATKGHKLSAEGRYFRAGEGGPIYLVARSLSLDGSRADTTARETLTAWDHPDERSLKLDYVRPLASGLRMETGYKGSFQHFHTTLDTKVFDTTSAAYRPDTTRINEFTYDEAVNAAYGMLNAQAGRFLLQGGLRAERATTTFHLTSQHTSFDNDYNSLFPSALVAYNVTDENQVKLSYSTRIRRPDDTDMIDPTPHYQDPQNLSRGNPYLQPEYIRALELGLQRSTDRSTIQLTPFFRHTLNAMRRLTTIDSAGVATRTFANVATSNSYGTDLTIAMRGGKLTGFAGASAFQQESDASNLGAGLSARSFGWSARTNASYRVSPVTDLQALLFYQAPMTVEQGTSGARVRFSLAGRQKLMDDRLSVTLRVIDPFNSARDQGTTIDPRFVQESVRRRPIRGLLLNLNWTFGKPQKDEERNRADLSADSPQ